MNKMKLCNATLKNLPQSIKRPTYDRSRLTAGIVHIGLGNFHRAHQSWYLHRLFEQGLNHDWAIVGAGVRPYDVQMREKLKAQDYLTTLIELDPSGVSAEVVGPMIDYVPVEDGNGPLIARMAEPDIRIVALTVTEGGYYVDPVSNRFDAAHPDIRHDAQNPDQPRTAFGAIVAALKLRRDRGVGPLSCLSCDNLQGNGHILHQTVTSLARLSDPGLADWIDANCTFPNAMVDCIVPATGPKEIALARSLGVEDAVPVTHENFRQWVIEDDFCAGRPDWDKVGATFSDRVKDYEKMKIRILNAGHQVIVNSAEILGIETISATMAHPRILALFRKVEMEEIVPHVAPVPGMTPERICRPDRAPLRQSGDRRHGQARRLRRLQPPHRHGPALGARRAGCPAHRSRGWHWSRPPGRGCAPGPARMAPRSSPTIRSGTTSWRPRQPPGTIPAPGSRCATIMATSPISRLRRRLRQVAHHDLGGRD